MTVKSSLDDMNNDELRTEQRRIVYMLQDDESYLQDIDGRRWCYERLNQIGAILTARGAPAATDERDERDAGGSS